MRSRASATRDWPPCGRRRRCDGRRGRAVTGARGRAVAGARLRAVAGVRLRALRTHARTGLHTVRAHPRHLLLFALVAGLLAATATPGWAVPAAAGTAAALAGRLPLAPVAAAAVLAGAALGDARLEALGPGALPRLAGASLEARAIVLEPPRRRADGSLVARAAAAIATPAIRAAASTADADSGPSRRPATKPNRTACRGWRRTASAPAPRRPAVRASPPPAASPGASRRSPGSRRAPRSSRSRRAPRARRGSSAR